jgi:hypothetical protein
MNADKERGAGVIERNDEPPPPPNPLPQGEGESLSLSSSPILSVFIRVYPWFQMLLASRPALRGQRDASEKTHDHSAAVPISFRGRRISNSSNSAGNVVMISRT